MTHADIANEKRHLGELGSKVTMVAGAIGVFGLIAAIVIGFVTAGKHDVPLGSHGSHGDGTVGWAPFFRAYLVGFCFLTFITLGGLFFTFIHHLTRAGWSTLLRRISEGIASNFIWLFVLFLPLLLLMLMGHGDILYHWADPAAVEHDEILQHKKAFLNPGRWMTFAVVYFVIWAGLSWFFYRNSIKQDRNGDVQLSRKMRTVAAPTAILFALSLTFAAFDWIMSLEPHWFSTIFGVYLFAASCCGFFSLMILICYFLQRSGRLTNVITAEHYQDMGKLLFAFGVVFWAYIAYSQYMLIWYGNLPEETGWWAVRHLPGWLGISTFLLVGHFVAPFLALISKHPKRRSAVLAVAAGWMLFMCCLDIYWLITPIVPAEYIHNAENWADLRRVWNTYVGELSGEGLGIHNSLQTAACVVGLFGVYIAVTAYRLRNVSLIPERDPRLNESLKFENM